MGTILTVAGADFSANAVGYNAPNTRGLTGLFLMGGTLTQSEKNLVSGTSPGSALNTPIVSSGYVTTSPANTVFTASIAGTVMTVTEVDFGTLSIGQALTATGGQGLTAGSVIASLGTGTGGTGTYNLNNSSTVTSQKLSGGSTGGRIISSASDSPSTTLIAVTRRALVPSLSIDSSHVCGNVGTIPSAAGCGLYFSATGVNGYLYVSVAGSPAAHAIGPVALSAFNTWNMVAIVIDGSGATVQVFNLSTGVASALTALGGTYIQSTLPFQIGSSPIAAAGSFAGQTDSALFESHNVALSLSELQAIYAAFKPVMTNRGIALV